MAPMAPIAPMAPMKPMTPLARMTQAMEMKAHPHQFHPPPLCQCLQDQCQHFIGKAVTD